MTQDNKSRVCSAGNCPRSHHAKGYCLRHYSSFHRHGDPLSAEPRDRYASLNFLNNEAISFDGEACLIWPFGRFKTGYGRIKFGGKTQLAHRVVCEIAHGDAPTKKHQAAHNCGNRICCNPKHLRWATQKENESDKLKHGTINRGRRNGRAKLTEEMVQLIRASTRPLRLVARDFGINSKTVVDIQSRKIWAWLEDAS